MIPTKLKQELEAEPEKALNVIGHLTSLVRSKGWRTLEDTLNEMKSDIVKEMKGRENLESLVDKMNAIDLMLTLPNDLIDLIKNLTKKDYQDEGFAYED